MTGLTAVAGLVVVPLDQLDPIPEPADVNAGVLGLIVFVGLIVSLVVLLVLMNRQIKRVDRKASEGAYDDLPPTRRTRGPVEDRSGDDTLGDDASG